MRSESSPRDEDPACVSAQGGVSFSTNWQKVYRKLVQRSRDIDINALLLIITVARPATSRAERCAMMMEDEGCNARACFQTEVHYTTDPDDLDAWFPR